MTAYELMLGLDTAFTTINAYKCKVDATDVVVTLIASCIEAEVNAVEQSNGTERAKRPSNLVAALTSTSTTASDLVTAA